VKSGVQSVSVSHTDSAPVRSTNLLLRLAVGHFPNRHQRQRPKRRSQLRWPPRRVLQLFARIFSARISISVQSTCRSRPHRMILGSEIAGRFERAIARAGGCQLVSCRHCGPPWSRFPSATFRRSCRSPTTRKRTSRDDFREGTHLQTEAADKQGMSAALLLSTTNDWTPSRSPRSSAPWRRTRAPTSAWLCHIQDQHRRALLSAYLGMRKPQPPRCRPACAASAVRAASMRGRGRAGRRAGSQPSPRG